MATTTRCAVIDPEPKAPVKIHTISIAEPERGSIVVKIDFAGICGTDPHLWKGDFPLPAPILLGHEGIGTVVSLGSVTKDHASEPLSVGDRVYWSGIRPCNECYACTIANDPCGCPDNNFMHTIEDAIQAGGSWATYSQYATVGSRNSFYKVSPDIPPESFIALGCALPTVIHAIGRLPNGSIGANENVVVQGAGAVGLAAVLMARLAGAARIVVLESNKLRAAKALDLGADECIDVEATSLEERKIKILDAFGARGGAGLVIECSGSPAAVSEGLDLLAREGKYLLIGTWAGRGTIPLDPFLIVNKAIKIIGSTYAAPADYYKATRVIQSNHTRFDFPSLITHKYPLSETQKGLEAVLRGDVVKGVVVPNSTEA